MFKPTQTDLTIFLGKAWHHATTKLEWTGRADGSERHSFTAVGLPPQVDGKSMELILRDKPDLFGSLSIQQPSQNILELFQSEKPKVVVDVSTQQKEKTLTGQYVASDYNSVKLQEEDGTLIEIPRTTIQSMRVVYDNKKPAPEMLYSLTIRLKMSERLTVDQLQYYIPRLTYFFNGVSAQVSHVFTVDDSLNQITVRSYLSLVMTEPSCRLESVKIRLIEDYREKVDTSRQQVYEEQAYETYAIPSQAEASPSMYTRAVVRKQPPAILQSKSSGYATKTGDDHEAVQQSMQQVMDVNTDSTRVLLEKSQENVVALGGHELTSAKVIFYLEKSTFSFLNLPGFKEAIQPLDARISWTKSEDNVVLFSGTSRFFVGDAPLSTDKVVFSPWKMGDEMTIDFPLSGFAFARRLLHRTDENQDGGTTKKVFRVDMYVSKHNTLKPGMLHFESLENIGEGAKQVKFVLRVTNTLVKSLQNGLDKANRIDPYNYPPSAAIAADNEGEITTYKNPDTGMYEPGVYRLRSSAKIRSGGDEWSGSMSHFFYEVLY